MFYEELVEILEGFGRQWESHNGGNVKLPGELVENWFELLLVSISLLLISSSLLLVLFQIAASFLQFAAVFL
jgi:hypothetical protein